MSIELGSGLYLELVSELGVNVRVRVSRFSSVLVLRSKSVFAL